MKKALIITLIITFAFALSSSVAFAKSDVSHLYLYEKNPVTWEIVDGAWGKMMYKSDSFVFNGHGLDPCSDYALIYYPDPWPGTGALVLGTGTPNKGGNVHIMGDFDFSLIPSHVDINDGAKIWLVLSADLTSIGNHPVLPEVELFKMIGWNPTEYLFEYELIN